MTPKEKPLNIGMIGYGFMGRAHSNAYRKVNNFFDLELPARPQGRLRPRRGQGQGVRRQVGLRVDRDRLAEAGRAQGHRRGRHLHAEQHARGDRPRRGRGGQDDPVREAAGDERGRGRGDGRGGREGQGRRTWSGTTTAASRPSRWPSSSSTRAGSAGSSTTGPSSSRTGRSSADLPQGGAGAVAARRRRGRQRRHRRPARPLHRHRPLAQRPDRRASRR